jgi:hypothetical protein
MKKIKKVLQPTISKDVVDMSSYINTTDLTYYNFSDVFYSDDDSGRII